MCSRHLLSHFWLQGFLNQSIVPASNFNHTHTLSPTHVCCYSRMLFCKAESLVVFQMNTLQCTSVRGICQCLPNLQSSMNISLSSSAYKIPATSTFSVEVLHQRPFVSLSVSFSTSTSAHMPLLKPSGPS